MLVIMDVVVMVGDCRLVVVVIVVVLGGCRRRQRGDLDARSHNNLAHPERRRDR